jgi:GNAT superfamily N-acetyltransferase
MPGELLRVGDVVVYALDLRELSDANVVALNRFANVLSTEAQPDEPTIPFERTASEMRFIPGTIAIHAFCARLPDGSVVALSRGSYRELDSNKHLLEISVEVLPDHRRRGLATAMLRPVVDLAEAHGRTLLSAATTDRVPAGEAFARRIGAKLVQAAHSNRLVLSEVDRDIVRRWVDEGPRRAPGYSLIWVDGPAPDHLIGQIAAVMRVMNDAPRDDRDLEDNHITADHYREMDRAAEKAGIAHLAVFARHDATGQLVGLTDVAWFRAEPRHISQQNTGVRPEHRGHALGKWLKASMLERLLTNGPTGAVEIRTGNADSNDAMLGINRELGFEPYIATSTWEVSTSDARAYLESR